MGLETADQSIAVVYLARGLPFGIEPVRTFLESYAMHDSGVRHSFYVIVKGWESLPGLDVVVGLAGGLGATVVPLTDAGFDFGAYFRIIPELREHWVCFLNTHSRIQARNWLAKLHRGASGINVGAAGATGSWESMVRNAELAPPGGGSRTAARGIARAAYHWLRFAPFPNPHLRSNALFTRTALFKDFSGRRNIPCTKRDAHGLESGRSGFSNFVRQRRLDLVVCGADGNLYEVKDWPDSGTFRSGDQRNLLVADNQTRHFEQQPAAVRDWLRAAAWGADR